MEPKKCTSCGVDNSSSARFCSNCANPFEETRGPINTNDGSVNISTRLGSEGNGLKQKENWFSSHKIISGILAVIVLIIFISALGGGKHKEYYEGGALMYEGGWSNGHPNGQGTYYSQAGNILYKGGFNYGLYEGQGKSYTEGTGNLADGYMYTSNVIYYLEYEGTFRNNLQDGEGTAYYPDGSILYKGGWKGGKYHGKGILYQYVEHGHPTVYHGEFADGNYEGEGTLTFIDPVDGVIYETTGTFSHGLTYDTTATKKPAIRSEYTEWIVKMYDKANESYESNSQNVPSEGSKDTATDEYGNEFGLD